MRFNKLTSRIKKILNHEGAPAWKMDPQMELYTAVVTSSLSHTFYEGDEQRVLRVRELIAANDPEFVAKLAVYARTEMHLRSMPLVLVAELAMIHRGDNLVSRTVEKVVQRADEITELLAYYQMANGREGVKKLNRLSKQVQKGLARAFMKFSEYQLAKYDRATEVRLRDALFLVHPKAATAGQQEVLDKLAADELATPYTWETELSALGSEVYISEEDKKLAFTDKWEELIANDALGYMAMMRNLRNMLNANISGEYVDVVCTRLADPDRVSRARQLPFRYLAAYKEVRDHPSGYTGMVLQALERAVVQSIGFMEGFGPDTRVAIASDVSGSMYMPVSRRSKVMLYDVGLMMSMMLKAKCQYVVSGVFGTNYKAVTLPAEPILGNTVEMTRIANTVGYATNGHLALTDLTKNRHVVDKVMVFTDCQLWDSTGNKGSLNRAWIHYKRMNPAAKLYVFDLAGYGQSPVRLPQKDVYLIAGWSDKVFEVLDHLENGGETLDMIEGVTL
ncbi:TROVE domain-containing protein [Roseivirga sp. BDSF3-8]|uniref:TROVE domain-containing protein n=1 Tax=Roseivirga sp. BDSF3-8 TaxID=3241598 RepID=UPI00353243FB